MMEREDNGRGYNGKAHGATGGLRAPPPRKRFHGRFRSSDWVEGNPAGTGILLVLCLLTACSPTVTSVPPAPDPAKVYLADFGTHANLVLPRPDGGFAEFTYADWYYAVEGNRGFYGSLQALAWPSRGALGRRLWSSPPSEKELQSTTGARRIGVFEVKRENALMLYRRLNRRFERQRSAGVKRALYGMEYVKDREAYSLFHTCNSEVEQWLRELEQRGDGNGGSDRFG